MNKSLAELGINYKEEYLPMLFRAMEMNEYQTLTTGEFSPTTYAKYLELYLPILKIYGKTGKDLRDVMFELEASQTKIDATVYSELNLLKQEYNLYCYTNWFREQALKKLNYHKLSQFFQEIYTPESAWLKYFKCAFTYVLYKYNLQPENAMVIGDSKTDIIPAHNAEIPTIYINYKINNFSLKENELKLINIADASITEFKDIRKILKK